MSVLNGVVIIRGRDDCFCVTRGSGSRQISILSKLFYFCSILFYSILFYLALLFQMADRRAGSHKQRSLSTTISMEISNHKLEATI